MRRERGEILLETILFAPLLFGMALLSLDFGAGALQRMRMEERAREAIRSSVLEVRDFEESFDVIELHTQADQLARSLLAKLALDLAEDNEAISIKVSVLRARPNDSVEQIASAKVGDPPNLIGDNSPGLLPKLSKLCSLPIFYGESVQSSSLDFVGVTVSATPRRFFRVLISPTFQHIELELIVPLRRCS